MGHGGRRIMLKSPREIELMRAAGNVVADVLSAIAERIRPGVSTSELDEIATRMIADAGGEALFRGVENPQAAFPFPASICSSVNEEVVHGIPDDRPLEEGDIVSVDCGVRLKGYCGDSARTFSVGRIAPDVQRLLDVTRETLEIAIRESRDGRMWSEVAGEMQKHVEAAGFGVVREFVGHGIGREMHEEPKVPNYVDRNGQDFRLVAGMTLAIEPMVTAGKPRVDFRDPKEGWSVVTVDRLPAAHFEHVVAIGPDGSEVLTLGG